jgi:hypothetical protein
MILMDTQYSLLRDQFEDEETWLTAPTTKLRHKGLALCIALEKNQVMTRWMETGRKTSCYGGARLDIDQITGREMLFMLQADDETLRDLWREQVAAKASEMKSGRRRARAWRWLRSLL